MRASDVVDYRRGLLPYYRLFAPTILWILLVSVDLVAGLSVVSLFVTFGFSAIIAASVYEHRKGFLRFAEGAVVVHRAWRRPVEFSLASARADFVRRPASYFRLLRIRDGARSLKIRSVVDVVSPLQRSMAVRPTIAVELREMGLSVSD